MKKTYLSDKNPRTEAKLNPIIFYDNNIKLYQPRLILYFPYPVLPLLYSGCLSPFFLIKSSAMRNRIEAAEALQTPPEIVCLRTQEALHIMKRVWPARVSEILELELLLQLYRNGDMFVQYNKPETVTKDNDTEIRTTSVILTHRSNLLRRNLPRLNFYSRVWERYKISSEAKAIGSDLQVSVRDWLPSLTSRRVGVGFRLYPGEGPKVQAILYEGLRYQKENLKFEIPIRELSMMQGEVNRLSKRPRFSPALQQH